MKRFYTDALKNFHKMFFVSFLFNTNYFEVRLNKTNQPMRKRYLNHVNNFILNRQTNTFRRPIQITFRGQLHTYIIYMI